MGFLNQPLPDVDRPVTKAHCGAKGRVKTTGDVGIRAGCDARES